MKQIAVSCFLYLVLCGMGVMAAHSTPLTREQRAEDKRLEQPITLHSPHLFLGELLENLSTSTGVSITANNRDESSGVPVCVYLTKVPLGDVLNALWSLNSYKDAIWHWDRFGKVGQYRYRLSQSAEARELAARLSRKIQSGFEQEAALLLKVAKMSPDERKTWLDKNKDTDPLVSDPRILGGINLLGEAFSSEMQAQILRGQASPTVQVNQLSPDAQAFIKQEQELAKPGGTLPATLRFLTVHDQNGVVPTLYIALEGLGGYGYVGGAPMAHKIYEDLTKNWVLPGDDLHDPLDSERISIPEKLRQLSSFFSTTSEELLSLTPKQSLAFQKQNNHATEIEFFQLSKGTPLSLIATLPAKQRFYASLQDKTVEQYLKILEKSSPKIISKWRTHLLLLSHPGRFLQVNDYAPWEKIKILKQTLTPNAPLAQLTRAIELSQLTSEQLTRLSADLPILRTAIAQRSWLSLYARFPEVATLEGLRLSSENIPILQGLIGTRVQVDWQIAVFLHMAETYQITKNYEEERVYRRTVMFTFLTEDKKSLAGDGFFYEKAVEDESGANIH